MSQTPLLRCLKERTGGRCYTGAAVCHSGSTGAVWNQQCLPQCGPSLFLQRAALQPPCCQPLGTNTQYSSTSWGTRDKCLLFLSVVSQPTAAKHLWGGQHGTVFSSTAHFIMHQCLSQGKGSDSGINSYEISLSRESSFTENQENSPNVHDTTVKCQH